jgi:hypothetical protein
MVQNSPFERPQAQRRFGPLYPARIAQMQQQLDEIFGVTDLKISLYTYGPDQLIWDWVPTVSSDGGATAVHWSWSLDRQARLIEAPAGMLTVQRRATNVAGLSPAVRIYAEDDLLISQTW